MIMNTVMAGTAIADAVTIMAITATVTGRIIAIEASMAIRVARDGRVTAIAMDCSRARDAVKADAADALRAGDAGRDFGKI
jgi:hypothetical protein